MVAVAGELGVRSDVFTVFLLLMGGRGQVYLHCFLAVEGR